MGFLVPVHTGEFGEVVLRGCADGCIEMCQQKMVVKEKGAPPEETLVAFKYYASPEQAFNRVLQMRVGSSQASTLKELVEALRHIRSDIKRELSTSI